MKPRVKAVGGGKTALLVNIKTEKILVQKQEVRENNNQQRSRGSAEVKQSYADKVKAERKSSTGKNCC